MKVDTLSTIDGTQSINFEAQSISVDVPSINDGTQNTTRQAQSINRDTQKFILDAQSTNDGVPNYFCGVLSFNVDTLSCTDEAVRFTVDARCFVPKP